MCSDSASSSGNRRPVFSSAFPKTISRRSHARFGVKVVRVALVASCALVAALWPGLVTAALADTGAVSAASGSHEMTLYSVTEQQQYVNHADERALGQGHNPFGNYAGASVTPPPNEKIFGPFPGDQGQFALNLYANRTQTKPVGTAILICEYNFDQNAFCDAAFQLSGGTLVAKGAFNFNGKTSSLGILGGTYTYRSVKGQVQMSALGIATQKQPVSRIVPLLEAQRLVFIIHPV